VPPRADTVIARLAARQHGVVSRAQLLVAGVTKSAIEARLRGGRLHPLHRGVYAAGHKAIGAKGRAMAAVLACGKGAALSHQSAGALWEIRPPWRGPVHVTAKQSGKRRGIVVHRAGSLDGCEITRHHGIPVTSPARTLVDLADVLPPRALERALAEAQIRNLIPRGEIPSAPGRRIVARRTAPTRSDLEIRFLALLDAHGLPGPLVNERVLGYEVDMHWPEARLVVELDGYAFHGTRKAFEEDRARDAELQAAGWRVIRVTDRGLDRPGSVAAQMRRLLTPEPARAPA
jgi:very-short-patch-repair endonuclease